MVEAKKRELQYITRSDVSWYSRNANAYQKPLMLSHAFDLTVIQPEGVTLPSEIAQGCRLEWIPCGDGSKRWTVRQMFRFIVGCARYVSKLKLGGRYSSGRGCMCPTGLIIATGFDIPCLLLGWWLKQRWKLKWFVFCWDPPVLSWRDRTDIFGRWVVACVNMIFRLTVRRADRLVLNIHAGMLGEVGFQPRGVQLVQMFNGCRPRKDGEETACGPGDPWCVGILSNATRSKGFDLVQDAFVLLAQKMPRLRIIWIGEVTDEVRVMSLNRLERSGISSSRFVLAGKVEQVEAFRILAKCGILLHPYLDLPSLRWNYPLKLVEYLSIGHAIVAADLPGVRAYITDGNNGLLYAAGDAHDLCRTLGGLVGNEKDQARLGLQAKKDSEKFEWPKLNQELAVKLHEGCSHGPG